MSSDSKRMSKNKASILIISGVVLIVIAIVLILNFFMRGETTVSGNFPDPEVSESISCELNSADDTILDLTDVTRASTKVNAVFVKKQLSSISLTYSLYYNSEEKINTSEAKNHANFNLSSQENGLGANIFNLHFTKLKDRLEIRMYAESKDITDKSSEYLLLRNTSNLSQSAVEKNYTDKGFKCKSSN